MKTVVALCSTFAISVALSAGGRPSQAGGGAYQVDPVHSSMMFKVKHMQVANFYGRFNNISGSFTLDDEPAKNSFDVSIQTASIDTANSKRDDHLKSPDYFNAVQFPTISFKSTSVQATAGGLDVKGDLNLHGVTKSVTAKVTKTGTGNMRGRQIAGIEAVLTIKRSEFGMTLMPEALSDEVQITVSLEGARR